MKDVIRQGRLGGERTHDIESFLSSMEADRFIAEPDLLVDMAHLLMLVRQKIVTEEIASALMKPLLRMYQEGVPTDAFDEQYEDIHAGIESGLTREAGSEAGGRLHIGRSRNDEVATCIRIKTRSEIFDQLHALIRLRRVLITRAREFRDTIMPGFTHLQHAQPTTLAHHLLAYEQAFGRDFSRLSDSLARVNLSPLGAAAFASTGYPIDRKMTADLLGFDGIVLNTMDAVAGRDTAGEILAADTILLTTLSRFCEELVIWSSAFVRFVDLNEIYCSTSSIMPQKKNPDVAEILRSRAGSLLGEFVSAITITKGLPMSYNRDLQDLNPHLWRGITGIRRDIDLLAGMIRTARFETERMAEEAGKGFSTATEVADQLVREFDIPFRTAHHIVGHAVRKGTMDLNTLDEAAIEVTGVSLSSRGLTQIIIDTALDPAVGVNIRRWPGGPAHSATEQAIIERERVLADDETELIERVSRVEEAISRLIKEAKRIAES
ncbi:argininosuccinate lyase [Methanospirillum lacunae]|uniref:Argininosuccinate lyase n=1 Tax=Methanospirillum lacunae TaxID=668570 RepID=A0A2V2N2M0_9EURY|nr:argininosuccinate lyase [Methanospirillum lacunae]PWR72810.1 argininosuccinate lyase [Methanospirillum lacunae]